MEFVLTEEELADLRRQRDEILLAEADRLQEFCTLVARHAPRRHSTCRLGCTLDLGSDHGILCGSCPALWLCPRMATLPPLKPTIFRMPENQP